MNDDLPSDRILWIMERHQVFLDRKRAQRLQSKEKPCPATTSAPAAPAPTSAGDTPASPSRSACAASTAEPNRGGRPSVDYARIIREHGPISMNGVARIAGRSAVAVLLWLRRHQHAHDITEIPGRPKLYRVGAP